MKCEKYHKIIHVTAGLVIMLLLMCVTAPASAGIDTAGMGEHEARVLDRINQYRQAPYAHAVSLGYDPSYLQQIGIAPETQFAAYIPDEELCGTAAEANVRAAAPEPGPPVPPVRQYMNETGAVLSFTHFIPVNTASALFVDNLFKSELNTGVFQFILPDLYTHAGVSVAPGVTAGRNAWFFSLVVGTAAKISDIQMLHLINQVRADPYLIPSYIPAEMRDLFRLNQRIYPLPTLRFQPMFFDEFLYGHARADALDHGLNADTDDSAGEYFNTRTSAAAWDNMIDARPVTDLFSALLFTEMSTWPYGAVIFSNHYTEAGVFVSVVPGEPVEAAGSPDESVRPGTGVVTLCAGSGTTDIPGVLPETLETRPDTPSVRIYGVLFDDYDDDTIYAPGEEIPGEVVSVYDVHRNLAARLVTDNAGHFFLELEPGRYWIFEAWRGEQFTRRIVFIEKDHFVKMGFSPPLHSELP